MTTSTDPVVPAPTQADPDTPTAPPPPLGNALTFDLKKPINQPQLVDQINQATSSSVQIAVALPATGDPAAPYSDTNPATLYVAPSSVDRQTVQGVIDAHTPDSQYAVPQVERDYAAVMQAAIDDSTIELTPDQIQQALRGLLRAAAQTQTGAAALVNTSRANS